MFLNKYQEHNSGYMLWINWGLFNLCNLGFIQDYFNLLILLETNIFVGRKLLFLLVFNFIKLVCKKKVNFFKYFCLLDIIWTLVIFHNDTSSLRCEFI